MSQYTATYAKIRKVQDLSHHGKPLYKYALEVRTIEADANIDSEVLPVRFETKEQAEAYAIRKDYKIAKTWYLAEQAECVYRDGSQNIYRNRKYVATEEDKEENKRIWAELQQKEKPKPKIELL